MAVTANKYAGSNALARYLYNLRLIFVSKTDTASTSSAGITKLYTATGSNTDGAMDQNSVTTQLNLKAPLASPTFTGTPKAPTAAVSTKNTQLATTAFVNTYNDTYIISNAEILALWEVANSSEQSY